MLGKQLLQLYHNNNLINIDEKNSVKHVAFHRLFDYFEVNDPFGSFKIVETSLHKLFSSNKSYITLFNNRLHTVTIYYANFPITI